MRKRAIPMLSALFIMLKLTSPVAADGSDKRPAVPAGLSREEAMRLGTAMYREGILLSGEYMQAAVEGDIPIDGSMFTCASCHMRSGLGSVEGTVITTPTNGEKLYRPRKSGQEFSDKQRKHLPAYFQVADSRPAYTDKSLARVLRTGIDPGGRKIDPIMPRYRLSGRDMEILIFYLRNLSSVPSPGVTGTTIRFATIVSDSVSKEDRDAVILPLEAYLRDRSARAGYYAARTQNEPFAEEMDKSSRRLALSIWVLKGTPDTWLAQLEDYYREDQVFAVLGGIAAGSWSSVHRFCEKKALPCILPVTDQPVISGSDWYTLYFSKGPYQEGEAAARYLGSGSGAAPGVPAAQIYRNTSQGNALAQGFRETREKLGMAEAEEISFDAGQKLPDTFWRDLVAKYCGGVLAVWLGIEDLAQMGKIAGPSPSLTLVVSAEVLGNDLNRIPEQMRPYTYITYPRRLPQDAERISLALKIWLKTRNIPESNLQASAHMYVLGTLLTEVLMHMQRNYYRDHFLDVFDMLQDQTYTVASYPRLSFGPGQRYASKGCYIVQLSSGEKPDIIKKSDWVIY